MIIPSPLWNGTFFTLRCITLGYIPRAMHTHNHDRARTLEWSVVDTGGVASAFHGETHTTGGTPHERNLQLVYTYIYIYTYGSSMHVIIHGSGTAAQGFYGPRLVSRCSFNSPLKRVWSFWPEVQGSLRGFSQIPYVPVSALLFLWVFVLY